MNSEHQNIINKGAKVWNDWRKSNPEIVPDLSDWCCIYSKKDVPDLTGVNLSHAKLKGAFIQGNGRDWPDEYAPTFENANFEFADLGESTIYLTHFRNANLRNVNFVKAKLQSMHFNGADLSYATFSSAELNWVGFEEAKLEETNFEGASLTDIRIPNVKLWSPIINEKTTATAIAIEVDAENKANISVDDLEMAQMFSLLLNTDKLKNLINVATEKVVLILGRFYKERKEILDAVRIELRNRGYIALVFDFEGPVRRDITETISLFSHLSRFVVADITDAKSIPQELQAVVPNLPSVIFKPILQNEMTQYAMFEHFMRYEWVLPIFLYENKEHLIASLENYIINPAIAKSDELLKQRKKLN